MSEGFQLECEPIINVLLVFTHPYGSVSSHQQDFSPFTLIGLLKEDMANKLGVPADQQVWRHKGHLLEDHMSLDDFDVDSDDVIEVSQKTT